MSARLKLFIIRKNSRSIYEINKHGTQNRRKLFEDKQEKKTEYECSQEKIIIQETFSNNAIDGIQDQHLIDFSFLSQQERTFNNNPKDLDEDQNQKIGFNNEQSEDTKNVDISQSLSLSMGISPIVSNIKRNTLTPQKYVNRKISKKDLNFINTILNKSQFKNNQNSNRIDGSKVKLQNIASFFQLEGDKHVEPSYYKLMSFYYVYKFLKTLLTGYINQNFNFLSDLQMKIINDQSYVCQKNSYSYQQQQTIIEKQKFQNIFERLLNLRKSQSKFQINASKDKSLFLRQINLFVSLFTRYILKIFVIINPNNFFLKLWDLTYLILFFAICLAYPFYFSFMNGDKSTLSKDAVFIIQSILIMTSLIDILLTSQTGIYVLGEIVLKREQVYKQYISQLLMKDILSVLVQILGILSTYGFPNFLAALLRINSVTNSLIYHLNKQNFNLKFYKKIKEKFSRMDWHRKLKQKLSSYYDLLQLISFLLIVIHIFGCGFYYVGHISVEIGLEETNWIIKNNLINSNIFDLYIRSIYFITITMVTIGYGDITPVNSIEIVYSIFISFITCGLFGYCINFIGSIFTDLSKKSKDFQKKLIVITKYLNSRNIDQSSQIRVLRYLEYLDESQEENILEGMLIELNYNQNQFYFIQKGYNILNSCSKDIKEDIMKQFYGTVIKKSRLFNETFSKEFIESLSLKMQEKCFAPGETIIERGQILENLYFITRGQTEYFFDKKDQKNSICMVNFLTNKEKYQNFFNKNSLKIR